MGPVRILGLLGGMSCESSIEYERIINERVRRHLGATHSADMIIRSFDFSEIETFQENGDWECASRLLATAAIDLQDAGAEAIVLCTNTMHRLADDLEAALSVPFLHIAEPTARAIQNAGVDRVLLLGTRYTMEQNFISSHLAARGVSTMIPTDPDREMVHRVIYDELVRGLINDGSRRLFIDMIRESVTMGASGVVAGCTEIELLISPDDLNVPLFPTARLHAEFAADWAMSDPIIPAKESR